MAKSVTWYDGKHPVTYDVNRKTARVVKVALDLFSEDMRAVTGQPARQEKNGAIIQVYQIDKLTDKEFKRLERLRLPIGRFITLPEAFCVTVRGGRIIVAGSDARGTAYGVMELSRMAGVSPWIWWGDVTPQRRDRLYLDNDFETVQAPSIPFRGISIDHERWSLAVWAGHQGERHMIPGTIGPKTYGHLFRLMLRLRANTLWPAYHEGQKDFFHVKGNKEVADSFDIIIENVRRQDTSAKGTLYYRAIQHLGWPHDKLWLSTLSPGREALDLENALKGGLRQRWVASVHDPKVAAYALSLFMDIAWDSDSVTSTTVDNHLTRWLRLQFGPEAGQLLAPVMRQYYHLTSLRQPEYMGWNLSPADNGSQAAEITSVRDTGFNPAAFGNELERYLMAYRSLRQQVGEIARQVSPRLHDAYFAAVTYPISASAAMAEKQLQAQEARTIPRKGQFLYDEEALTAGANSVKAHREIEQLTRYYNDTLAGGKWRGLMDAAPRGLPVFKKPLLPDSMPNELVERYADPTYRYASIDQKAYGVVARNAADFSKSNVRIDPIVTLGHSGKAIALPGGACLSYDFAASKGGTYLLRLAFIPTFACESGTPLRFRIQLDRQDPKTLTLRLAPRSQELSESLLRGQAIVSIPVTLTKGTHTLTLQTVDDQLVFDQWMLDGNPGRDFYVIPVD